MLGDTKPKSLSAFTTLLQKHLPPVDTVNAIWLTKSGISGTFSLSFGTTFASGAEYNFACEKGNVVIGTTQKNGKRVGTVTVTLIGEEPVTEEFPDEGSGVHQEVGLILDFLCLCCEKC